jgi:hypothetical protein
LTLRAAEILAIRLRRGIIPPGWATETLGPSALGLLAATSATRRAAEARLAAPISAWATELSTSATAGRARFGLVRRQLTVLVAVEFEQILGRCVDFRGLDGVVVVRIDGGENRVGWWPEAALSAVGPTLLSASTLLAAARSAETALLLWLGG